MIPQQDIAALKEVVGLLEALADPDSVKCAVSKEARQEAMLYVKTWCIPPLRAIIERHCGKGLKEPKFK